MSDGLTLDQGELRVLPIDAIDPPDVTMREMMTDEGLESLVASIKAIGLLQNLVVVAAGDRFRVAAGHRRRLALARAGKSHAHCLVFPEGTPLEEAAKVAENDEHEPVNPAAEATYYRWLLDERCAGDAEKVAAIARRKLSHVLDRLDLTRGYPEVLEALRHPSQRKPDSPLATVFPERDLTRVGQVSLAVARELNKVPLDNYRALFLKDAIDQGATARTVRTWREDLARTMRVNQSLEEANDGGAAPSTAAPIESVDACSICLTTDDAHEMIYVRVHRSCQAAHRRNLLRG